MNSNNTTTDEYDYHSEDSDFVDVEAQNHDQVSIISPSANNVNHTRMKIVSIIITFTCVAALVIMYSELNLDIAIDQIFKRQLLGAPINDDPASGYKMLDGLVKHEGNDKGTSYSSMDSVINSKRSQQEFSNGINECNQQCGNLSGCQSYVVCFWDSHTECWFKDKVITDSVAMNEMAKKDPETLHHGKKYCFTVKKVQTTETKALPASSQIHFDPLQKAAVSSEDVVSKDGSKFSQEISNHMASSEQQINSGLSSDQTSSVQIVEGPQRPCEGGCVDQSMRCCAIEIKGDYHCISRAAAEAAEIAQMGHGCIPPSIEEHTSKESGDGDAIVQVIKEQKRGSACGNGAGCEGWLKCCETELSPDKGYHCVSSGAAAFMIRSDRGQCE